MAYYIPPTSAVTRFPDLLDVPHSYSGQAGKYPKVKTTEDGLEFATPSVGATISFPGSQVFNGTAPNTWTDLNLSSYVGSNSALVFLRIRNNSVTTTSFMFRKNGATQESDDNTPNRFGLEGYHEAYVVMVTDTAGIIEWASSNSGITATIWLEAYIK
jgi:hypothetical protein